MKIFKRSICEFNFFEVVQRGKKYAFAVAVAK